MNKKKNIILLMVLVAVLATGTVVESLRGNDFARAHVYGTWWFYTLMSLMALNVVWLTQKKKLWHEPYSLLLNASVLLILAGGALTALTGQHGSMMLHPGVTSSQFTLDDGESKELPFSLTLERFDVESYPGTATPMDYVSMVRIDDGELVRVSMNNILQHRGYRFYQEDYDEQGGSVLRVAHDPWGISLTYTGYVMLLLGVVTMFASRNSGFRRLLRNGIPLAVVAVAQCSTLQASPRTLPRVTADKMGEMYVLYNGRVCPLQTMAKDYVTKLYGNARYQGLSAMQVMSGFLFYNDDWIMEPVIKLKGVEVREMVGVDGKYASYAEFQTLQAGRHTTKDIRSAIEKQALVEGLLSGKQPKLFPIAGECASMSATTTGGDEALGWYAQNDVLPLSMDDDEYLFVRRWTSYCQELVVRGDFEELERLFAKTREYQEKKVGDALPSDLACRAEHLYNALTTGKWLAMCAVTLGLLAFALSLYSSRRIVEILTTVAVAALTLFAGLLFVLRWIIGGHIPMAGGFDTMNLVTIVIGITGLVVERRVGNASAISLLAMGFCQLVAMMSGSNPPVTHLMPVLNSPLLTLHVTVIMISYALFFFVMMSSVWSLLRHAGITPRLQLLLLYPAVSLLAIGIVLGAVWANISWGNYWSWDPKEVWALITLLVYLYPLMDNSLAKRPRAFFLYCVLAFLSVVVTYFGVNLVLGGVHAYN